MKLILLRHGKSDWDVPVNDPIERLLKKRGRKDAKRMGEFFADMPPDLIVCSPSVRTRKTAELFAKTAGYTKEIKIDQRMYNAGHEKLLEVVHDLQGDHVVMVCHNPGIGNLAAYLDEEGGRKIAAHLHMVTAAAACLAFDGLGSWDEVKEESGQLRALITPRFLKDLIV